MNDVDLIQANNIYQSFNVGGEKLEVLKGVSFNITDNTFNIVYGPSGSGKSTLLNILTGLQKPTSGSIIFDHDDVYNFTSNKLAQFRAHKIGFVYQQNFWVKSLNVLENVAMPLYFLGYSRTKSVPLAMLALERVGMQSFAKKKPLFLSGGEQQRVAMARALVNDPLFIIADEPTGSLDSKNGDMIMNLLQNCKNEFKRTVILVTHNMEYLPLADHLIHIEDGQIEDMQNKDIEETTNKLMKQLRVRVDNLLKNRDSKTND
jgi:putative ABC transport system ATP-binding protein